MELSIKALNQVGIMFLIVLLGIFCSRIKMLTEEVNRKLSDFILLIVNPLLIFISYQRDYDAKLLKGLLLSILLAFVTHFIFILAAGIAIKKRIKENENLEMAVERFSCIYSNCGFMGIPLVNGLFGMEGVFYLTAYMTVFNIFVWTQGVRLMVGKMKGKEMIKTLLSPAILATVLGFLAFLLQVRIRGPVEEAASYVASMNTPLAMLVAGGTMADVDWKRMFQKKRIYLVTFIKLILVPALILFIYQYLPIDSTILGTTVIAAACPVAVTGTLFALRYDKNRTYAAELFTVTTLFSAVSIPVIMFFV